MRRLWFVIRRDVSREFRVSANLQEHIPKKLFRLMLVMAYLLKAVVCGLRAIRSEQLGSRVIYQNRECVICNWANSESPTLSADGFYQEYVPRSEIRNIFDLSEILHRFQFGFEFFTGNWMSIHVNRWLYPSMSRF